MPVVPRLPHGSLRRDLWITTADAAAYRVMVGCGETYIPAFALALGFGPVATGLTASAPLFVGAVLQLVTPLAVRRLGTNRGWVVATTAVQAISFLPLIWWALRGRAEPWELLIAVSIYWSAGMAGAPAWNAWMGTLIPERMRTPYFAHRSRLGQFAVLAGFVAGGLLLEWGKRRGVLLPTFAVLFSLASGCRLVSTLCLAACRELKPPSKEVPTDTHRGPGGEESARAGLADGWRRVRALAAGPAGTLVTYLWAITFACQFSGAYFSPYMLKDRQFSYLSYMLVVAVSFLARALVLPSLGRLGSRIGSLGLLWLGGLAIAPLTLFWLVSADIPYLVGVQVVAGASWAAYELAVVLLFFETASHRERTGVVTAYNLGHAVAWVSGAACGGLLLRALGEDRNAYYAVFVVSAILRVAAIPLLRRVHLPQQSSANATR
jgi:MFS family permease